MKAPSVRVRFAPSPTGYLHLGNIRTALINYLYARQHNGVYVLRVEDTDTKRTIDPQAHEIRNMLTWLNLPYDEGPGCEGTYGPYFQSERTDIYEAYKQKLLNAGYLYRCFMTQDELEAQRAEQMARGKPPRYQRCNLTETEEQECLNNNEPFIWRFKLPEGKVHIHDLLRNIVLFELHNFADFPITRQDGSFTFLFTNCIDDITMNITHIFRGEDHLSNSALQAAMYTALNEPMPYFCHLPIMVNTEGKKLSKRDFGFSAYELRDSGFLSEAIINYLAVIGGSYQNEIMSHDELIKAVDVEKMRATGVITYDVEKLRWFNHQWIQQLEANDLAQRCHRFLVAAYDEKMVPYVKQLVPIIERIKTDLVTLSDSVHALRFYFEQPPLVESILTTCNITEHIDDLRSISTHIQPTDSSSAFADYVKSLGAKHKNLKYLFWLIRVAITGSPRGLPVHDLVEIIGVPEALSRINRLIDQT